MYRTRKATRQYLPEKHIVKLSKGELECPFCALPKEQIVKDYRHFVIIQNKYQYHYWELMDVTEHLMIVPKRHVESIGQYNKAERLEVIDIIAEWEQQGYNVYAREKDSKMKSVPHQHIHLIKTNNKRAKLALYIRKPYFLLKK